MAITLIKKLSNLKFVLVWLGLFGILAMQTLAQTTTHDPIDVVVEVDEYSNIAFDSLPPCETNACFYALMSQLAYNPGDSNSVNELRINDWIEIARTDIEADDSEIGYFGIAYQNIATNQVVVAHRGTNEFLIKRWSVVRFIPVITWGDIISDMQLSIDSIPFQFTDGVMPFIDEIVCKNLIESGYQSNDEECKRSLIHTGHSLGGWLAEYAAYTYQTRAFSFDSPGTGNLISLASNPRQFITTYLGPPNLVNTWNEHAGELILTDPAWEELRGEYYRDSESRIPGWDNAINLYQYLKYTKEAHSIGRIIRYLKLQGTNPGVNVTSCWIVGFRKGLANFRNPSLNVSCVLVEETQPSLDLLDLIFVIDTTGSMEDDIDEVKREAINIVNAVASSSASWQMGIVTYRDHPIEPFGDPGDYVSRVELEFSSDRAEIISSINAIRVGGGGDYEEAVYSGIMSAIGFRWRDGAKKAVIVMGDAPPHDPEPETRLTLATVLQAAFDVDPANIYPLMIADEAETYHSFQALADGSSGRLFNALTADEVIEVLNSTIESIAYDPELSRLVGPGAIGYVNTLGGIRLNLRSEPDLRSSILDRLSSGTILTFLAGPVFNSPYVWWNIETSDGSEGWVAEASRGLITLIPEAAVERGSTLSQFEFNDEIILLSEDGAEMWVRSSPSIEEPSFTAVFPGSVGKIISTSPESDETGRLWYQVELKPNGVTGWIEDYRVYPLNYDPYLKEIACPGSIGFAFENGQRFIIPPGDGPSTLWSRPNSNPPVGRVGESEGGEIIGGPVCKDGQEGPLYAWEVITDTGLRGWINEGYPDSLVPWMAPVPQDLG